MPHRRSRCHGACGDTQPRAMRASRSRSGTRGLQHPWRSPPTPAVHRPRPRQDGRKVRGPGGTWRRWCFDATLPVRPRECVQSTQPRFSAAWTGKLMPPPRKAKGRRALALPTRCGGALAYVRHGPAGGHPGVRAGPPKPGWPSACHAVSAAAVVCSAVPAHALGDGRQVGSCRYMYRAARVSVLRIPPCPPWSQYGN